MAQSTDVRKMQRRIDMSTVNRKRRGWSLKKFLIIGAICLLIGTGSMILLSGSLPRNLISFLYNAGYSLMLGYGLFANGYVFSLVEEKWLSWVKRPVKSLFIALVVTTLYSSVVIFFTNWFWYGFLMKVSWSDFWPYGKRIILLEYVVLYLITQFFYARSFFFEWRQSLLAEEKLKQESISLQYKVLSNQVNPHFLFNSLNVLSSLIRINTERAEAFVSKLSGFYRDLLSFRGKDIVSLNEEMEFVSQYIDLQKERFGDNFVVEIKLANQESMQVIPMTIQMLVENAIKHNQMNNENKLKISIYTNHEYLVVENSYHPYLNASDGERLGLKNLNERYEYLTDKPMLVEKGEDKFVVKIPLLIMEANG